MEMGWRLFFLRALALVALALSVALLMTYLLPDTATCPFELDCTDVLSSRYGKIAGIPLPLVGILTFGAIFTCSLSSHPRAGALLRYLNLATCAGGLALLGIQFLVLGRLCPFCLLVDLCPLGMAYASFDWRADAWPILSNRARPLWLGAAVVALGLGTALGSIQVWHAAEENTLPPQVAEHWVPGKVTIVEAVDFQCHHCRLMHHLLTQFLREQGEGLRLVRIMAPMDKHPQARHAARAYLYAQAQGKGEQMAQALFAAEDLSPESCERLAVSLGLSRKDFRAGVADAEIDRQIDANLAWVMPAAPKGLPCIWVQDRRLTGEISYETLRAAVVAAELRSGVRANEVFSHVHLPLSRLREASHAR